MGYNSIVCYTGTVNVTIGSYWCCSSILLRFPASNRNPSLAFNPKRTNQPVGIGTLPRVSGLIDKFAGILRLIWPTRNQEKQQQKNGSPTYGRIVLQLTLPTRRLGAHRLSNLGPCENPPTFSTHCLAVVFALSGNRIRLVCAPVMRTFKSLCHIV